MTEDRNNIDWATNQESPKNTAFMDTEYHLIRQILLLLHRKLNDIGHIVRTLRPYSSEEIFSFLFQFNSPSHVKIQQNSFEREESMLAFENSAQARDSKIFPHKRNISQRFVPDVRGNIIQEDLSNSFLVSKSRSYNGKENNLQMSE